MRRYANQFFLDRPTLFFELWSGDKKLFFLSPALQVNFCIRKLAGNKTKSDKS